MNLFPINKNTIFDLNNTDAISDHFLNLTGYHILLRSVLLNLKFDWFLYSVLIISKLHFN